MNAEIAVEYNSGFRKPRAGFPAKISWSFRSEIIAANTGADALVPLSCFSTPP